MRLFTKTFAKDVAWLELAIISVLRNTRSEIDWTIVCDRGERGLFERIISETQRFKRQDAPSITIHSIEIQDHWKDAEGLGSGYIQQQWVKMNAHRVMGNDYFLNWDSDVIALRNFTSKSFMNAMDKPILWFTPFNDLINGGDAEVHRMRQAYIKNVFKIPEAPFEWMRCMPIWLNGEILRVASERPEWNRTNILIRANELNGLSEFNLIGQFSHTFFPDAYDYKNTQNSCPTWGGPIDSTTAIVHQSWSYGGISEQVKAFVYGL